MSTEDHYRPPLQMFQGDVSVGYQEELNLTDSSHICLRTKTVHIGQSLDLCISLRLNNYDVCLEVKLSPDFLFLLRCLNVLSCIFRLRPLPRNYGELRNRKMTRKGFWIWMIIRCGEIQRGARLVSKHVCDSVGKTIFFRYCILLEGKATSIFWALGLRTQALN
jgi:hypothetical protein